MFANHLKSIVKEKKQGTKRIIFPTVLALLLAVLALMSIGAGVSLAEEPIQVTTIDPSPQVTFDLEAVRQYFDTEWVIEADTIDLNSNEAVTTSVSSNPQIIFKREAVQAYFDNEWVIEADTIDVDQSQWASRNSVSPGQVTFNLDAVREYFDKEWVIETDAVDMGLDRLVYAAKN